MPRCPSSRPSTQCQGSEPTMPGSARISRSSAPTNQVFHLLSRILKSLLSSLSKLRKKVNTSRPKTASSCRWPESDPRGSSLSLPKLPTITLLPISPKAAGRYSTTFLSGGEDSSRISRCAGSPGLRCSVTIVDRLFSNVTLSTGCYLRGREIGFWRNSSLSNQHAAT